MNEEWKRVTYENMGLGGLHIPLTVPASVRYIKGDGNCFFRSISYVITGYEEQHEFVRSTILIHMRTFGHLLFLWLNGRTMTMSKSTFSFQGWKQMAHGLQMLRCLRCHIYLGSACMPLMSVTANGADTAHATLTT